MPKPFDATLKGMLEESPADWAALAGFPGAAADVVDADVSTFTGGADKVVRVRGAPDVLLHFDFQSGPDRSLPRRLHLYNALLEDRHDLPVRSVLVLLRPQADLAALTGVYERALPGERPYLTFRYRVVRVWQMPADSLLAGGPGTLPLAPISDVSAAQLPGVIRRLKERLRRQPRASDLWTATYVLLGLRHPPEFIAQLLRGVVAMEESSTYQEIIRVGLARGMEQGLQQGLRQGRQEGALQEARKTVLLLGTKRFGAPGPDALATLEAVDDLGRLEAMALRVLDAGGWEELLAPPARRGRRGRRP